MASDATWNLDEPLWSGLETRQLTGLAVFGDFDIKGAASISDSFDRDVAAVCLRCRRAAWEDERLAFDPNGLTLLSTGNPSWRIQLH